MDRLKEKRALLEGILRRVGPPAVALSGGVDSGYLFAEAVRVWGERALGITARSPSLPEEERRLIPETVQRIGGRHLWIETAEGDIPEYVDNPPDRCYYCKRELFSRMKVAAEKEGIRTVLFGMTRDDLSDYRPGHRAAREAGVAAPLFEAGFTKGDVRRGAREMGLPIWDRPSSPCLASRIPYGEKVTDEKLRAVETGERILHEKGFAVSRLRHLGSWGRIEVGPGLIPRLLGSPLWATITREMSLEVTGLERLALDPRGYRSGALNEALDGT